MCKLTHRVVCENKCWSLTSKGYMLVITHRIVYENMWYVYMWHCALINYLYVFLNDFKILFHMY